MVNILMVIIWIILMVNSDLVGGFNPPEKYESQLGLLFPIYMYIYMAKMFQTTNQIVNGVYKPTYK